MVEKERLKLFEILKQDSMEFDELLFVWILNSNEVEDYEIE
jgi:hypothetical protein